MTKTLAFLATMILFQTIPKATMDRGRTVYEQNCLACHMDDGSGVPNMNPPLKKTQWVLGDKKKLIGVVVNGLNDEIEINGETYHNPMPGMDYLTDLQISDVLTYVRNSFGNKAAPVTPQDVKAYRAANKK
jgi:mono/diheme cytochrome c family protein